MSHLRGEPAISGSGSGPHPAGRAGCAGAGRDTPSARHAPGTGEGPASRFVAHVLNTTGRRVEPTRPGGHGDSGTGPGPYGDEAAAGRTAVFNGEPGGPTGASGREAPAGA
jgi:hypothetical protein